MARFHAKKASSKEAGGQEATVARGRTGEATAEESIGGRGKAVTASSKALRSQGAA